MVTQFLLTVLLSVVSWLTMSSAPVAANLNIPLPGIPLTALVTQVIDGDTIDVQIGTSTTPTRVRYIGINTPEPYPKNNPTPECGSREATAFNRALVEGQTVTLVTDTGAFDSYQRLLAYVYVGEVFVNAELVRRGYATTMSIKPNTRYRRLFTRLRDEAKTASVGNWQLCPH